MVTHVRSTPVLVSWSGGKDAAWTLHSLQSSVTYERYEVVGLLSTITDGVQRAAMQGVRVEVLHAQAHAAGLPLLEMRIAAKASDPEYERALVDVLRRARTRWPGLAHIAFGDLFLADIRAWREALCARLGWTPLFPLFGADNAALARTMIDAGLRATLCRVDTLQLPARFAGRAFDAALLADLPAGVDPCGERGEFHTCVSDGPMFAHALALAKGGTTMHDGRFADTDLALRQA